MSQFVGSPRLFRAVNLSHKKDFVPVSTLRKRFTHPQFALSFVIIPGVIHEGDAPIDCLLDQANRLRWRQCWLANVRPPKPYCGHPFPGPSKRSIKHFAPKLARILCSGQHRAHRVLLTVRRVLTLLPYRSRSATTQSGHDSHFNEITPLHSRNDKKGHPLNGSMVSVFPRRAAFQLPANPPTRNPRCGLGPHRVRAPVLRFVRG
jgi:hypothetical protein